MEQDRAGLDGRHLAIRRGAEVPSDRPRNYGLARGHTTYATVDKTKEYGVHGRPAHTYDEPIAPVAGQLLCGISAITARVGQVVSSRIQAERRSSDDIACDVARLSVIRFSYAGKDKWQTQKHRNHCPS